MIWIIKDTTNEDATMFYINVIKDSLLRICTDVYLAETCFDKRIRRADYIIVTTPIHFFKFYVRNFHNIIVWFQGVFSEESFLKHHSYIRKWSLKIIEILILRKSIFNIFVSKTMMDYYCAFTKVILKRNNFYIMPCFNSSIIRNSFFEPSKYVNNYFCYLGSLSAWQGFEKIVDLYKKIEEFPIENSKLFVFTKDKINATLIIKNKGIQNYHVDYVPLDKLEQSLKKMKYGFIIRDDTIINRASTPTKISTYLANGLIPIYTKNLNDFHNRAKDMSFKLVYDHTSFFTEMYHLATKIIHPDDIYQEYKQLFDTYFNRDEHINNLSTIFKTLIKKTKC